MIDFITIIIIICSQSKAQIMKCIYISINNDITLDDIEINDLLNRYELYCPIHKYQLSIGVIPLYHLA